MTGETINHLAMAFLSLADFAIHLTAHLITIGYPPHAPPTDNVPWAKSRAEHPMPADVFNLHETLRDTVYQMSTLRQMIQRQKV